MNVKEFLAEQHIAFESLSHARTYDAQRMAQSLDVSGDVVGKTVLLRSDDDYVLAVVQATHQIDCEKARAAIGASKVEVATELEFASRFPDCEIGALPPFGSHYGLRTIVDKPLSQNDAIVFEGNTHDEAIRLKYADFARLEQPLVAEFTHHV